jgi:predicted DNA-binding ribbon-helix-helix protein
MVWDILAEMAEAEGCTTNHLIVTFHDEILAHRGEVPNFASFLRVTGMRFLRRKLMALEVDRPNELGGAGSSSRPKVVALGARS